MLGADAWLAFMFFFFKQKTAYEMRISDWSSDVCSSDLLYKDGLQRARFLPAIELLKKHTEIVNVDSGIDYRLRALEQAELFHFPLDAEAEQSLERDRQSVVSGQSESVSVDIGGRRIIKKQSQCESHYI